MRTFSKNTELVRKRREQVRKCATNLFVKTPFEKASMKEILQACGMSKGGLYYYVGSKEDIRSLILDHASEAYIDIHHNMLEEIKTLNATSALRKVIQTMCRWMDEYQDEVIVIIHELVHLTREQLEPQLRSETENLTLIESIIRRGIASGDFKTDDPRIVAYTIYLGIGAWAERRWYLQKLYTLERYVDSLAEFAIGYLQNRESTNMELDMKTVK
jgi:AcrR family transcriptional regulator